MKKYIDNLGKEITEEQYYQRDENGECVIFEAYEVDHDYVPLGYHESKLFNQLHEQLQRYEEENNYDHNSPQTKLLNALNNWKREIGV